MNLNFYFVRLAQTALGTVVVCALLVVGCKKRKDHYRAHPDDRGDRGEG